MAISTFKSSLLELQVCINLGLNPPFSIQQQVVIGREGWELGAMNPG